MVSRIGSKKVTRKTADADDRACGSGSDAAMGGLVVRKCAHNERISTYINLL